MIKLTFFFIALFAIEKPMAWIVTFMTIFAIFGFAILKILAFWPATIRMFPFAFLIIAEFTEFAIAVFSHFE